jgi:putative membrane protein
MGFGFVVARFGLFLREMAALRPDVTLRHSSASQWVGVVLVLLGTASLVYAAFDHRQTNYKIAHGEPLGAGRDWAGIILAALLALLGLFIAGYLMFVMH